MGSFLCNRKYLRESPRGNPGIDFISENGVRFTTPCLPIGTNANVVPIKGGLDEVLNEKKTQKFCVIKLLTNRIDLKLHARGTGSLSIANGTCTYAN